VPLAVAPVEVRAHGGANSGVTLLAVPAPTAERRAGLLVFDCSPQPARERGVATLGSDRSEDPDVEDATGAIV